jgi:hypothetical protein
VVSDATQVGVGEPLRVTLARGALDVRVEAVAPAEAPAGEKA